MDTETKDCALCTLPGAIFCQACASKEVGDAVNIRWYCTTLCQETDRPNHKQDCDKKAAQKLFKQATRASEIVQAIFYAFIEHTWAYDITEINIFKDVEGNFLGLETVAGPGVASGPIGNSTCERHAGGWLLKFPDSAFGPLDQPAKHALLASENSIWGFVVMEAAVRLLFQDMVSDVKHDIKELVHYLPDNFMGAVSHKDPLGRVEQPRSELPYFDHDMFGIVKAVYQITLKDGTKIALDLAGAQYNRVHETMVPWPTYIKHSFGGVKYCVAFGSHYEKYSDSIADYKCITHLTIIMEQLVYLNDLIKDSEYALGLTLQDALEEETSVFLEFKDSLVEKMDVRLRLRPEEIDDGFHQSIVGNFDLRHPKFAAKRDDDSLELFLAGWDNMRTFDWSLLRKAIRMPNSKHSINYYEKKKVKSLLQHRCAYKVPEDWRMVFLSDSLPPACIADEFVNANPFWMNRK